jgi:tRNA nucleotidyltransferase (CCA-adding enzyme)
MSSANRFTVYKLGQHLDVSIPRRERKSGRGHKAFVIEGDPSMSVAEAHARRDFTINAILQDPLTGELIDPYERTARHRAARAARGFDGDVC